jgi:ubiquinone/menaquinone biosynthesis C-methylase UbiE
VYNQNNKHTGTGLLVKPLSSLVPEGKLYASDISPEFRQHIAQRIEKEQLTNVEVVEAGVKDVIVQKPPVDGLSAAAAAPLPLFQLALMIDVYHHLEYPRTICRKLRKMMAPDGRLVVIDFFRDPVKSSFLHVYSYKIVYIHVCFVITLPLEKKNE